jgi:hypothetical protein
MNRLTIATLNGMINANIAENAGDMVYSAGVGVGGANPTAALTAETILEAKQTLGDESENVQILMMHSRLYTNLQKAELIDFIPDGKANVSLPYYLGYRVVVGDSLPVVSLGGGDFKYVSYLSAPGIVGYGESSPDVPVEVERKPAQGNGMGVEVLYTRRQFTLQPMGHNWKEASVVYEFPTTAELELATNWERKYPERKQVPFVAIFTKNG